MFYPASVKTIVNHTVLLKVRDGQILYKEGDSAFMRTYIVLVGKFALKGFLGKEDRLGVIGYVEGGDTLGEEGVYETAHAKRRDTAVAEGDCYVFEILKENFEKLKQVIQKSEHPLDWFTLNNHMKRQWVSKRSWRLYKEQEV